MANAYQVRASINRWLDAVLPINTNLTGDRIAHQAAQEIRQNEWRIHWDAEQSGRWDQSAGRLMQIDRLRGDGDEIGLEMELAAALAAMGLARPGDSAGVPIYDYPTDKTALITTAQVKRNNGDGWRFLPDVALRPGQLRATITLTLDYPA